MNRKIARENTFILLFESACKNDETSEEIFSKAVEYRNFEYDDYVKDVFFGVFSNKKIIDETSEASLKGWKKERISAVSRALLNLAIYEMIFLDDIRIE